MKLPEPLQFSSQVPQVMPVISQHPLKEDTDAYHYSCYVFKDATGKAE